MKRILTILIATLISVFVFFHFGLLDGWIQSVTAILIVFVIAFLFTTWRPTPSPLSARTPCRA